MTDSTLLGRPITGEISHYSTGSGEQRPIEELLEALDDVLASDAVEAIRWTQYTPYFNDGEACEFSVHEPYIRFVDGDEEAGEREDGFVDSAGDYPPGYWDTHARREYDRVPSEGRWGGFRWVEKPTPEGMLPEDDDDRGFYIGGERNEKLREAFQSFSQLVQCGAFDLKLHEVFGDPAEVTATREGFNVERYDHD